MLEEKKNDANITGGELNLSRKVFSLFKRGHSHDEEPLFIKKQKEIILRGHSGGVNCALFLGAYLVSGGDDSVIKLWNYSNGELLRVFKGHKDPITRITALSNQRGFLSASRDGTVRYWDIDTGKSEVIFDTKTYKIYKRIPVVSLATSSVGGEVLLCSQEDLPIYIWDSRQNGIYHLSGRLGELFPISTDSYQYIGPCGGTDVAFSLDGKYAATCSERTIFIWDFIQGEIYYYFGGVPTKFFVNQTDIFVMNMSDPIAGRMTQIQEDMGKRHKGIVTSIAFIPYSNRIVSGSEDRTIRIWDFSSKYNMASPPMIIDGHDGAVRSVAISPDGEYIISGSDDAIIRVFEVNTGTLKNEFVGHNGGVTHVDVSPNGNLIASCGHDGTIRIWNFD